MRTFGCYCTRSANDAFNKFTDKLIFTSLAITLDKKSKTVPDKSCYKILNPYLMNLLKLFAIYVIKKLKILHVNDFTDTEFWHLITPRVQMFVLILQYLVQVYTEYFILPDCSHVQYTKSVKDHQKLPFYF